CARCIPEEAANALFDDIMEFARHAFNKSHAAAYAIVSYQTAWLKYHYPAEFLCDMFNNKDQEGYAPLVDDCASYGIALLLPEINRSESGFVVGWDTIRSGLDGKMGLRGSGVVYWILKNRRMRFQYASILFLPVFARRISLIRKLFF